jgi:hypothetical protein
MHDGSVIEKFVTSLVLLALIAVTTISFLVVFLAQTGFLT